MNDDYTTSNEGTEGHVHPFCKPTGPCPKSDMKCTCKDQPEPPARNNNNGHPACKRLEVLKKRQQQQHQYTIAQ